MLKDITLGQFFPGKSVLHRMDPRFKIVLTILYITVLFLATNFASLGVAALMFAVAAIISRISFVLMLKSVKPIWPLLVFTVILNTIYINGDVLVRFWIFKITTQGIILSSVMAIRIILIIMGTSLLTYTTSPIALTDALERLMKPLNYVKFPVHDVAMMMTIALRFIPTLIEETDKIMNAQKARGADLESGGLMQRVRALVPILVPLFVSAFRRADELALAMECRCYRGGDGRTRLKQLKATLVDLYGTLFSAVCLGGVIAFNLLLPSVLR